MENKLFIELRRFELSPTDVNVNAEKHSYNGFTGLEGEEAYSQFLRKCFSDFFDKLSDKIANEVVFHKEEVLQYLNMLLLNIHSINDEVLQQVLGCGFDGCIDGMQNDIKAGNKNICLRNELSCLIFFRNMSQIQLGYIEQTKEKLLALINNFSHRIVPEKKNKECERDESHDEYMELLVEYGDLLTIADLCEIFEISRVTVNNWEREGKIKRTDVNGRPRYLKSEIKRILIQNHPEILRRRKK